MLLRASAPGSTSEIVEVHGVRQLQRFAERPIDRRDRLRERIHRQLLVLASASPVRSSRRRSPTGCARGVNCFGEMLVPLHQALDDAERVVLIVDRERRRAPDEVRRRAQHPRADRVERADPHARGLERRAGAPMRSRISPAALFVNVTARMWRGSTPSMSISRAMRVVSTRVLPDPAPASTSNGPSTCSTASRCAGLSPAVSFSSSNIDISEE